MLAEREREGLDAGVEERDLAGAIGNRPALPDELVEPLLDDGAVALIVGVAAVGLVWRLAVDQGAEPDRCSRCRRSHHQVEVAGVEAVGDLVAAGLRCPRLFGHGPITGQGPMVEMQVIGGGVKLRLNRYGAAWRREVLGAVVAGVVLRRPQGGPIGRNLWADGVNGNQVSADLYRPGLSQQLLDDHFRLLVLAFAEVMMPDTALSVSEVQGWPVVIPERAPDGVVV